MKIDIYKLEEAIRDRVNNYCRKNFLCEPDELDVIVFSEKPNKIYITGELDYEGLDQLAEEGNKVFKEARIDSYFDFETSGRAVAYIEELADLPVEDCVKDEENTEPDREIKPEDLVVEKELANSIKNDMNSVLTFYDDEVLTYITSYEYEEYPVYKNSPSSKIKSIYFRDKTVTVTAEYKEKLVDEKCVDELVQQIGKEYHTLKMAADTDHYEIDDIDLAWIIKDITINRSLPVGNKNAYIITILIEFNYYLTNSEIKEIYNESIN